MITVFGLILPLAAAPMDRAEELGRAGSSGGTPQETYEKRRDLKVWNSGLCQWMKKTGSR